jgi:hypothetical protein
MKVVNTKVVKEVWVTNDQDEYKVKLVRFPLSRSLFAPNDPDAFVKLAWQRFDYCLLDWDGIVDENDKPLECNTDNKRIVFDFDEDMMLWIATQIHLLEGPETKKKLKKSRT